MEAVLSMEQWNHHTPYRFFLQKYPQEDSHFNMLDVEETFKCRYVKMTNNAPTDVKNIYTEDFCEMDGSKVWIPYPTDLTYKSSEISLYLRWRSDECGDVHEWSQKFFDYVSGQKIEWHDTFRPNRFWQLILEKAPSVETEILSSNPKYLIMKYTFNNFGGQYYRISKFLKPI